jgi:hypothetical protein
MVFIHGFMHGQMPGRRFGIVPKPDVAAQILVLVLQRQQVIGLRLNNGFGDALLTAQRVNRYRRTGNVHRSEIAAISLVFSPPAYCVNTQRALPAYALRKCTALSPTRLPRNVLPSQQICSPDRLHHNE